MRFRLNIDYSYFISRLNIDHSYIIFIWNIDYFKYRLDEI